MPAIHQGGSTIRNAFVNYRGGAMSRGGFAYIGTCKQQGTAAPPRDIPFQFNNDQGYVLEFGDQYMRIKYRGGYVTEAAQNITAATNANPAVITIVGHGYTTGDWVYINGMTGMVNLNKLAWVVTVTGVNTFTLTDMFGNVFNSLTSAVWVSGGTAARIYTVVAPYAAIDLPYLKYTQSADLMTLTCLNTVTKTEYIPYNLKRSGNTSWAFTAISFAAVIAPPTNVVATAQSSTAADTYYGYVVTAIDSVTGQESIASTPCEIINNNISIYRGSNTITWKSVTSASSYNVYKSATCYNDHIKIGVLYGFCGTSLGGSFLDSNITQDFTKVPPVQTNPFARGAITDVVVTAPGTGYTLSNVGYSITTSTGSGFIGQPLVISGGVVGFIVQNTGSGYLPGDTVNITGGGVGVGALATPTIGPQTGTYPGAVAYYQQRRAYASTLNNPDTYWMSQAGAFSNMDVSIPVTDNDAITGTPWSQQVNGIQFMTAMPGGLVVFTGKSIWQVNGGAAGTALTPSSQTATAQGTSGCSSICPPIPVNYNILYLQPKGSTIRELEYNLFAQIYITKDQTVRSSHLFYNHTILQWAYCEEPYKLIWAVRDDGVLLCFTYLKDQEVWSWTRHDTNGQVVGICTITEPPVDAAYAIVKRYVQGKWMYYSERMDNRLWQTAEQSFCVDAGVTTTADSYLPATLTASQSGIGTGVIFTASAGVWAVTDITDTIRMGGGSAVITGYLSPTQVVATITSPITAVVPNDPNMTPLPAAPGAWASYSAVNSISGLNHLEGLTVSILADGGTLAPQVVTNGTITLPSTASLVTVGLPFTVQIQTNYLDPQGLPVTAQGKRKTIFRVIARLNASRGGSVGANQPDASIQPNNAEIPWTGLTQIKYRTANNYMGTAIPLFSGDIPITVQDSWQTGGQVAIQSTEPLPIHVIALVSEFMLADTHG